MNSLAGVAHSLPGCQPLLVLRPTGPITAITIKPCCIKPCCIRFYFSHSHVLMCSALAFVF